MEADPPTNRIEVEKEGFAVGDDEVVKYTRNDRP
jgi:hypothetical protein